MVETQIKPLRVFIVDDHAMVLAGVRSLLEDFADIEVVGTAASFVDAMEGIGQTAPDVALIDLRLPDGTGAQLCKEGRLKSPRTRFLVLSPATPTTDRSLMRSQSASMGIY